MTMEFRFWRYEYLPDGSRPAESRGAEILPGLWYVGGYNYCCYLLLTDAGPVMVDAGVAEESQLYSEGIRRAGSDPADLVAIIHTHSHPDHIGATPQLVALSGARTMIGEADAPELAQHVAVDRVLRDGDEIEFSGTRLRFIHTPGHTRGCGMYLTAFAGARVCFTGDAAGPFIFEEVRWDGDAEAFRASAQRMKQVEADLYLPGHPHQTLEVSPSGDPKLTGEQWHRYIDGRVAKMESTIAGQRR